jgi:dynactin complex subunit
VELGAQPYTIGTLKTASGVFLRHIYMEVGTRISCQGEICTIRFIGIIPQWKNVIAYGVEWDDPERGKHDGSLDGIEYYKCNVNGAGSFIKSTRVLDPDQCCEEAVPV